MKRKDRGTEQITVSLPPGYKRSLEGRAAYYGCLWGSRPSIARLMRAIAEGEICLTRSPGVEDKRVAELQSKISTAIAVLNGGKGEHK